MTLVAKDKQKESSNKQQPQIRGHGDEIEMSNSLQFQDDGISIACVE